MSGVTVLEPEDMHVAGLLLGRILEAAGRSGPAAGLPGRVLVDAGGMLATIVPREGGHDIARGRVEPVAASLRAPLATLVALGGGGSVLRAFFAGGLRASGSPRALLALRSLLVAARAP